MFPHITSFYMCTIVHYSIGIYKYLSSLVSDAFSVVGAMIGDFPQKQKQPKPMPPPSHLPATSQPPPHFSRPTVNNSEACSTETVVFLVDSWGTFDGTGKVRRQHKRRNLRKPEGRKNQAWVRIFVVDSMAYGWVSIVISI